MEGNGRGRGYGQGAWNARERGFGVGFRARGRGRGVGGGRGGPPNHPPPQAPLGAPTGPRAQTGGAPAGGGGQGAMAAPSSTPRCANCAGQHFWFDGVCGTCLHCGQIGAHQGQKYPTGMATGAIPRDTLPQVSEDDRRMQLGNHYRRITELTAERAELRSGNSVLRNIIARHDGASTTGSLGPAGGVGATNAGPAPVAMVPAVGTTADETSGATVAAGLIAIAKSRAHWPAPPERTANDPKALSRWRRNRKKIDARKAREAAHGCNTGSDGDDEEMVKAGEEQEEEGGVNVLGEGVTSLSMEGESLPANGSQADGAVSRNEEQVGHRVEGEMGVERPPAPISTDSRPETTDEPGRSEEAVEQLYSTDDEVG